MPKTWSAAWLRTRGAVTQLWNEAGSPRNFKSKKKEADFRDNVRRKAAQNSRLQFLMVAVAVMPKSVLNLRHLMIELRHSKPVSLWEGSICAVVAVADLTLVCLSCWASFCAVTKAAEKALSSLSWHRLLTLCLGAKALSGGMSSPGVSVAIVAIGLSGIFIIPSFSQNLASVFLIGLLHCLALALQGDGPVWDPDLPQFLSCTVVCLVPAIAWFHGNRRRRFLADAATSTFKLALAVNRSTGHGETTIATVDPYFEEEEVEELQEEIKRETALMAERDTCRTDAPRDQLFVSSKILGRGSYGIVRLAIDTITNEKMALKQCCLGGRQRKTLTGQNALLSEVAKLRVLRHAHIVEYKASTLRNDSLSLLVEMCGGGSLKKVLRDGGALPEEQARACMRQLLSGAHYIHLLGLAHLDLKPQNVLVRQGELKISDFGSSKWVHSEASRTIRGTLPYLSPEVAKMEGGGRKSDVWALGAVMLELLTCEFLWAELKEENKGQEGTQDNVLKRLQALTEVPAIPSASRLSPPALACVQACFAVKPADRPTAYKLQQHAFFTAHAADVVLDEARFGAPGTDNDRSLQDARPWWFERWYARPNEAFANAEMEREFVIAFSSPRLNLLMPIARFDAVVRSLFKFFSLLRDPSYENAAVLAVMVPNLALVFAPLGPETLVQFVRWVARGKTLFWLLCVRQREPYFTNLWTVTLTMMIGCQLSVQVLETVFLFGFVGVVLQVPYLAEDIWTILRRTARSGDSWRDEVEDTLSMAVLLVLTHITCALFSHSYIKGERRKFFRTYYMRLAADDAGTQKLPKYTPNPHSDSSPSSGDFTREACQ